MILNKNKKKIDMMELHFKYSMEGLGYKEVQFDFVKRIS